MKCLFTVHGFQDIKCDLNISASSCSLLEWQWCWQTNWKWGEPFIANGMAICHAAPWSYLDGDVRQRNYTGQAECFDQHALAVLRKHQDIAADTSGVVPSRGATAEISLRKTETGNTGFLHEDSRAGWPWGCRRQTADRPTVRKEEDRRCGGTDWRGQRGPRMQGLISPITNQGIVDWSQDAGDSLASRGRGQVWLRWNLIPDWGSVFQLRISLAILMLFEPGFQIESWLNLRPQETPRFPQVLVAKDAVHCRQGK